MHWTYIIIVKEPEVQKREHRDELENSYENLSFYHLFNIAVVHHRPLMHQRIYCKFVDSSGLGVKV